MASSGLDERVKLVAVGAATCVYAGIISFGNWFRADCWLGGLVDAELGDATRSAGSGIDSGPIQHASRLRDNARPFMMQRSTPMMSTGCKDVEKLAIRSVDLSELLICLLGYCEGQILTATELK